MVSDVKERKVKILAKIDNPIFISNTENTNEKQVKYIIDNDIRYGGVLLNEIMSKNDSDNEIYITYKAEKIDVPEEDYYLLLICKHYQKQKHLVFQEFYLLNFNENWL